MIFRPGGKYSRSDVSEVLGLGSEGRGGIWVSGIREHRGEFFIFPNVGSAGSIGDDFGNRWEDNRLRWFHKKGSRPDWPSVRKLLDAGRAHVFWRSSTQDLFEYAGYGRIEETFGSSPVGFLWSFDSPASDSDLLRQLGLHAAALEREAVPQHEFHVGDRVRHPELGWGRVLAISGREASASATMFFAKLDERREVALSEVERVAGFGSAPL